MSNTIKKSNSLIEWLVCPLWLTVINCIVHVPHWQCQMKNSSREPLTQLFSSNRINCRLTLQWGRQSVMVKGAVNCSSIIQVLTDWQPHWPNIPVCTIETRYFSPEENINSPLPACSADKNNQWDYFHSQIPSERDKCCFFLGGEMFFGFIFF